MDCRALLENDRLILETGKIKRVYKFNNGHLISELLEDKTTRTIWNQDISDGFTLGWGAKDIETDFTLPGANPAPEKGLFEVTEVPTTKYASEYLQVKVSFFIGKVEVMREFKLYSDSPAISCTYFLRGETDQVWLKDNEDTVNAPMESADDVVVVDIPAPMLEKLYFPKRHIQGTCVQFFDITDIRNNLVKKDTFLPYGRASEHSGNLIMGVDLLDDEGFFCLKEAPCSDIQMASPGFDFTIDKRHLKVLGLGTLPSDLKKDEWTRAYGFVTGLATGGEEGLVNALRMHKECVRKFNHKRDSMILLNTWGDRSQDRALNEEFSKKELDLAAKLGVTKFQLDAGWQQESFETILAGHDKRTHLWEPKDAWHVHEERFPNGLEPIVEKAKEVGIELCLWYGPCAGYDYKNGEKDAEVLLDFYRKFGIRIFKIDGVLIYSRQGELNLRKFLDKVKAGTNDEAVFNLDTTAGKRFGYNYFDEYGNYFIENRYTDWNNYYPHWVLRNLWQLSEYIPPQFMQFEFLNNMRNPQCYDEGDPLAPQQIDFEYCFAITMASQPLAWFEASGLPEESLKAADAIKAYGQHQEAFHQGRVLPIGDEPLGTSWTGFQSSAGNQGYFIIFREMNENQQQKVKVRGLTGETIKCTPICGKGKEFTGTVTPCGKLEFELPENFSYAFYKYEVK